ncbi:hypothetical protein [Fodinibius sediminis]|uniref:Uncharacterized protein n=1 Tax=Fodinibius sediminis TaxID=1214077 RepID=A0A521CGA8_9BACT|nr:hypothetical protein [Fodinibius sediminis]SMO58468.1 hypothetical protein SAMN06265218_10651 [Fodinibius sediminis]
MSNGFDLDAFEADLEDTLQRGCEAFRGKYRKELNELAGLSRSEIDAITPGITDLEKYDELMTVVKEASRVNLSQAQLKRIVEDLGSTAVVIARKVPSLGSFI